MTGAERAWRPDPAGGPPVTHALTYAHRGWPVLPLHRPTPCGCSCNCADCASPGKHPRTRHGLADATTDPRRVAGWWRRWPDANIGVATGGDAGIVVIDVDPPDGEPSLARLAADRPLPDTLTARTGSGGRHLVFAYPQAGESVRNRAGMRPGLDVRGDGGYVVVPPSAHASGRAYAWLDQDLPPAQLPGWLLAQISLPRLAEPWHCPPPRSPATAWGSRYGRRAVEDELARLAVARPGGRNDQLNRSAFALGQLVGAGVLSHAQVRDRLERAALSIGLTRTETRRTVASGLAAGTARPRVLRVPDTRVGGGLRGIDPSGDQDRGLELS